MVTIAGSAASPRVPARELAVVAGLGVAATAISAIGSGTASLWGDEAASVLSAQRSLGSLANMAAHVDAVHALYYAGLHVWIQLVGATPFAVRFPSAVAIGVTVSLLVLLGRRVGGFRFGVLAGIVAALLPRLTDVGSEARSYAFTAAIATLLGLLVTELLIRTSRRRRVWIAYAAVLAAGTLLFLWVALVAVAHLAVLLASRRDLVREWIASVAVALAVASPVLVFAVLERGQIAYLATRQTYDATSLLVTPWFENPAVAVASWPLLLAGIVLSVRTWWHGRRRWEVRTPALGTALLPVAWMLLPSVALVASSAVVAVYTPRYLAMCAPAAALLVALPIDALLAAALRARLAAGRRGLRALGVAVAVIALGGVLAVDAPVWAAQRTPYAKNNSDWAAISATLAARATPGDAIAFDDSTRPSRRPRLALRTYPAGFVGLRDVTLQTPYWRTTSWYDATMTVAEAASAGRLAGVHRLWLVEYALPGQVDTDGIAAATAAGFHRVSVTRLHRSEVLEFVRG